MSRHLDLAVSAGTTLNYGLRFHTVGTPVALDTVAAGDWIYYKGQPWPVFAVDPPAAGLVRIQLGRGQFWEPDVYARADTLAVPAVPAVVTEVDVSYRDDLGAWRPLHYGLAASDTEIRVLPHDQASRDFTGSLAGALEAGGSASYRWQAVARYPSPPGWRRLAEGALLVTSGAYSLALGP